MKNLQLQMYNIVGINPYIRTHGYAAVGTLVTLVNLVPFIVFVNDRHIRYYQYFHI